MVTSSAEVRARSCIPTFRSVLRALPDESCLLPVQHLLHIFNSSFSLNKADTGGAIFAQDTALAIDEVRCCPPLFHRPARSVWLMTADVSCRPNL